MARPDPANDKGNGVDVTYSDLFGTKVAVAVVINKDHAKSFEQISNTLRSTSFVDRLIILTNANTMSGTKRSLLVDHRHVQDDRPDLLSKKYNNNEIHHDDSQRAILLAKSISLVLTLCCLSRFQPLLMLPPCISFNITPFLLISQALVSSLLHAYLTHKFFYGRSYIDERLGANGRGSAF